MLGSASKIYFSSEQKGKMEFSRVWSMEALGAFSEVWSRDERQAAKNPPESWRDGTKHENLFVFD